MLPAVQRARVAAKRPLTLNGIRFIGSFNSVDAASTAAASASLETHANLVISRLLDRHIRL